MYFVYSSNTRIFASKYRLLIFCTTAVPSFCLAHHRQAHTMNSQRIYISTWYFVHTTAAVYDTILCLHHYLLTWFITDDDITKCTSTCLLYMSTCTFFFLPTATAMIHDVFTSLSERGSTVVEYDYNEHKDKDISTSVFLDIVWYVTLLFFCRKDVNVLASQADCYGEVENRNSAQRAFLCWDPTSRAPIGFLAELPISQEFSPKSAAFA